MAKFIKFPTELLEIARELEENPELVQILEECLAMTSIEESPSNPCPIYASPKAESNDSPSSNSERSTGS